MGWGDRRWHSGTQAQWHTGTQPPHHCRTISSMMGTQALPPQSSNPPEPASPNPNFLSSLPLALNRGTAQKFCEIHRSVESGDPAGRLKLDSVEMMMMMTITVKMIWAMTNEARQMNDDDNDERRLHLNDDVDDEGGMSVESG